MNLATTYLGLRLRTPLVPSASPLSESVGGIRQMEDAGAAAVVFHSLLEERECESVEQIKGSMSQRHCPNPSEFERVQYVHALSTYSQRHARG